MEIPNKPSNFFEIDQIISKLLSVREERPGKLVNLPEEEIMFLIWTS